MNIFKLKSFVGKTLDQVGSQERSALLRGTKGIIGNLFNTIQKVALVTGISDSLNLNFQDIRTKLNPLATPALSVLQDDFLLFQQQLNALTPRSLEAATFFSEQIFPYLYYGTAFLEIALFYLSLVILINTFLFTMRIHRDKSSTKRPIVFAMNLTEKGLIAYLPMQINRPSIRLLVPHFFLRILGLLVVLALLGVGIESTFLFFYAISIGMPMIELQLALVKHVLVVSNGISLFTLSTGINTIPGVAFSGKVLSSIIALAGVFCRPFLFGFGFGGPSPSPSLPSTPRTDFVSTPQSIPVIPEPTRLEKNSPVNPRNVQRNVQNFYNFSRPSPSPGNQSGFSSPEQLLGPSDEPSEAPTSPFLNQHPDIPSVREGSS
jgi:hypothetical protein